MKKTVKVKARSYLDRYFRIWFERLEEHNRISDAKLNYLTDKIDYLERQVNELYNLGDQNRDLLTVGYENIAGLKKGLEKLRSSEEYKKALSKKQPMVSVRIATYNRAKLLTERSLPSILKQTYQNFEVVVVGDHCTDDTEARIKALGDKRIRFHNLPQHTYYPGDKYKRWLVVGAHPANKAIEMAKGEWIATLDDDDEFRPNHLETLVKLAQENQSELAYGALLSTHENTKKQKVIYSDPPVPGEFSMMGAIYLRLLYRLFPSDELGWAVRLPQDWYLCKRMLEAGVRFSSTDTVTGEIHLLTYEEKKDI